MLAFQMVIKGRYAVFKARSERLELHSEDAQLTKVNIARRVRKQKSMGNMRS